MMNAGNTKSANEETRKAQRKILMDLFVLRLFLFSYLLLAIPPIFSITSARPQNAKQSRQPSMREINKIAQPGDGKPIAIVGATLIDGRGGEAIGDSAVIVRGEQIVAVGARASVKALNDAEIIDAR